MSVIATDVYRLSNTLKAELFPEIGYCRTVGTYNGVAGDLKIGTVLGIVTATGKWKVAVQSAADGSQNAAGILLQDKTVALNTDTPLLILFRGPASVSKSALTFDATFDLQAELDAAYAQLEAKGIQVLNAA